LHDDFFRFNVRKINHRILFVGRVKIKGLHFGDLGEKKAGIKNQQEQAKMSVHRA